MWDTAGQEIFDALSEQYFRKADAAIIVYDVSKYDTFENCNHWGEVLTDRFDRKSVERDFVTIIACNKIDLEDEYHAVEKEEAEELKAKIGADELAYISA